VRLVLCDDHVLLLDALESVLARHGHEVVAAVTTPDAALEAVREHRPDVLLLDAYFPEGSGVAAIPQLVEASPGTRIVVLSAAAEPRMVSSAVEAGAVGFARKDRGLDGILRALERVLQGELVIDTELLREVVARPPHDSPEDTQWRARFLTAREREVLDRLLAGQSTADMAREMGIARSTARTHVQNVLQKLGVHSRLQAAAVMFGDPKKPEKKHGGPA
jgi:two-component system nitrate/nitrite response regulator NarL